MRQPKWYPRIRLARLGWRGKGKRKHYLFGYCKTWKRKRPKIRIDDDLAPFEFFETVVHELCHATMPKASEKKVTRVAYRIAKVMWDHGFRLKKKNGFRY